MKKLITTIAILLAICLVAGIAIHITAAQAEAGVVAVDGAKFITAKTMEDNIRGFMGKKISLLMNSGQKVTGKVKAVKQGKVHMESLEGAKYYDALVKISDVSAVIARFKEFK